MDEFILINDIKSKIRYEAKSGITELEEKYYKQFAGKCKRLFGVFSQKRKPAYKAGFCNLDSIFILASEEK